MTGDARLTGDGADDRSPLTEDELTRAGPRPSDPGPAGRRRRAAGRLSSGRTPGLLPAWYMPTPMARVSPRWRLPVVLALVAAFVIIEAFGLCSTFGQIVPA